MAQTLPAGTTIRRELPKDYSAIAALLKSAFADDPHSDHSEEELVARLRSSSSFIPELALVAEQNATIVGYILFTKVHIQHHSHRFESLSLAPVAVLPAYQKKGIGGALITQGHSIARSLGYTSVMLLGHPGYYPRFGYEQASRFGIKFPFEAPLEACMAFALRPGILDEISGVVVYPQAFYE